MKKTVGNFSFEFTDIGCVVIEPKVFEDSRGSFQETYNEDAFLRAGLPTIYVQDNESFSTAGVLRGLHIQSPHYQGKLVRVSSGRVYDVVVDIRDGSKTFGTWFGVILSEHNKKMMYVPTGFAHGFLALEDSTFVYKCTDVYHPGEDYTIKYDDAYLNIDWKEKALLIPNFTVSEKDQKGISFKEFLKNEKR